MFIHYTYLNFKAHNISFFKLFLFLNYIIYNAVCFIKTLTIVHINYYNNQLTDFIIESNILIIRHTMCKIKKKCF